ncbi:uncharacterized protein TNCV_216511 [Trichonephila clavipes]|nr:uncharacterized protein TNCV_216511 [Trichonephila clavipes]
MCPKRLYKMCPKRLYKVCLETVVPLAEESRRERSDAARRLFLMPVIDKYRSSFGVVTREATCAVTSTHITIILESLPKPGDDILGDSKFFGYFQLGTFTFKSSNNSST